MSAQGPPPVEPEPVRSELEAAASRGLLTRRTLLKLGGAAGALLAAGGWAYRAFLWSAPPGPGLEVLSTEELGIADAIAEAFFPGPPQTPLSAREVGLGRFIDRYLAELYEDQRDLFRLVLRLLEAAPALGSGHGFSRLAVPARQEVLAAWQRSRLLYKRVAYQTLRFAFAMGYFEDGRVRNALGLRIGCAAAERVPEWTKAVE